MVAVGVARLHYAHLGVSWRSFFLAVLVGAQLFHSVLDSILMFAGLLTGKADYGYLDWLGALGWSAFGNLARETHQRQQVRWGGTPGAVPLSPASGKAYRSAGFTG